MAALIKRISSMPELQKSYGDAVYGKLGRVLGGPQSCCLVYAIYSSNDNKTLEKKRCRAGLKYKLKSTASQRTELTHNMHLCIPAASPTGGQL